MQSGGGETDKVGGTWLYLTDPVGFTVWAKSGMGLMSWVMEESRKMVFRVRGVFGWTRASTLRI